MFGKISSNYKEQNDEKDFYYMGFFKSSQKSNKGAEPPLKKVNITELLEKSNGNKELKEVEIPVAKDFSSIPQSNPENEYLAGSNATYAQIPDKEGLDETKEMPRSLISDLIGDKTDLAEETNSTLIFGVAGSGKTNGRMEIHEDEKAHEDDVVSDTMYEDESNAIFEISSSFNEAEDKFYLEDPNEAEDELVSVSEDSEESFTLDETTVAENVEENLELEDGEDMKIETIQVPRVFNNWHEQADKAKSVFEVYAEIEASGNEKLIAWVHNNQNEFAKIWLGALIPELEIQYYITKIANYEQVSPNLLVRTAEGQYMVKTSADILDTDVTNLTEEEIRKDWGYLFENGFSELIED